MLGGKSPPLLLPQACVESESRFGDLNQEGEKGPQIEVVFLNIPLLAPAVE